MTKATEGEIRKAEKTGKCPRCGSKMLTNWNWEDCSACNFHYKRYEREPVAQKEALDLLPDGPEYMDYEY